MPSLRSEDQHVGGGFLFRWGVHPGLVRFTPEQRIHPAAVLTPGRRGEGIGWEPRL